VIARVNNKVCEVVHASAKATGPVSSETIVTSSSEVIAKALAEPVREKLKPKPHQKEASKAVVQGFQAADRGQLILPCGAGKTYTALQIKEKMQAKTTLCVVPSIPLVSQMKNAWLNDKKKDFDYLCVCSDPSVNSVEQGEETEKEFKELKQEAREKVTTNVEDIVKYIKTKRKNDSVIFVTYDSVPKIKQALEHTKTEFDLAIIDEAHNTAGANDKVVSPIHSNADIAIKKRLYMTATPKVHSKRDEAKVAAGEILSMSDEKIFGREFHRMSFAKAIEKGILVDYKIIAVGIDEDELFRTNKHLPEEERKHKAYSRALKKVMDKYGTSHALTFHSRIKGSKEFTSFHNGQFPQEVECFHVDGSMPVKERNRLIGVFEKIEGKQAVLSNVFNRRNRCAWNRRGLFF
jgi:predicted helicase